MDRIMARGLTFTARHGVLPEEKVQPQTFIIDLDLYLDLHPAAGTDDLKDTVSYADVYEEVSRIVLNETYNLLETLAEKIAETLLAAHPQLKEVEISVYKPEAPITGKFDYFAVNIRRFQK